MIWQNPWAWLGIAGLALPILIHLLGRGHARIQKFPTLRFLDPSRLLPTRRTRVHDAMLLAVRLAILTTAVAALAQPLWLTTRRVQRLDAALARAIIVDTSASMSRLAATGERAVDVARSTAKRLAGEAQSSTIVETADPARAIAGAAAWLSRQPGRAELAIVSDFQTGTIDSSTVAGVASTFGLRFDRIAVRPTSGAIADSTQLGGAVVVANVTATADRTDVEWATASSNRADSIVILAAETERTRAHAALTAARTMGVRLPLDTAHLRDVAVVTPQFEERASLVQRASTPTRAWMVDLVARLRADDALQQGTSGESSVGAETVKGIVAVRGAAARPTVIALQDGERLLLVSAADAGSLTTALLIASTTRALSLAAPLAELEPSAIADNTLAAWQRQPAASVASRTSAGAESGNTDGRWLWVFALLLMTLELWMRRARRDVDVVQQVQDRAA
jgi:hypothetical protein